MRCNRVSLGRITVHISELRGDIRVGKSLAKVVHFRRPAEASGWSALAGARLLPVELMRRFQTDCPEDSLIRILLASCAVYIYTIRVITSYRHKGLRAFAESGSKAGVQPKHAERLRRLLTALDVAAEPRDMAAPGNNLHALSRNLSGQWAVKVDGNWRLTFAFEREDVILLDYQDYH